MIGWQTISKYRFVWRSNGYFAAIRAHGEFGALGFVAIERKQTVLICLIRPVRNLNFAPRGIIMFRYMSVDLNEIKKISALARIEMTEDEMSEMRGDIESVLNYVKMIMDVSSGENAPNAGIPRNVMREDENPHNSGEYSGDMLKAMPKTKNGCLKTPKILR